MKEHWKRYVLWILGTEAAGVLSAFLTRQAQANFNQTALQPPLSPPSIVFPIAWGILYALMGFGAARMDLSMPTQNRSSALGLYGLQLAVNFLWSLIFFNAQAYAFAVIWLVLLWALVVVMIAKFRLVDKTAALLQIPYLLWLTFALYLNMGVWLLNR